MKLTVVATTGGIERQLVAQPVAAGHGVTIPARRIILLATMNQPGRSPTPPVRRPRSSPSHS